MSRSLGTNMALLACLIQFLKAAGQWRLKRVHSVCKLCVCVKFPVYKRTTAHQICLHKFCYILYSTVAGSSSEAFVLFAFLLVKPVMFASQAKRKRTTAQAHPRRSSATPKRAELKIEDAGPSTAALPAQQMGDDAQQDELQMESSQGGATARSPAGTAAGSPAWEAEGMHAGSGHQSDVHEREAPKTLASRISRFAGIFIGRKTTPDTPTGGCSVHFNGACYVCAIIQRESMSSLGAVYISANRRSCRHKQAVKKNSWNNLQLQHSAMMLHQACQNKAEVL